MINNLSSYRNQQKLTQREVAQKVKISLRAYQYIESSVKSPSVHTAILLAHLFDTTVEKLFTQ